MKKRIIRIFSYICIFVLLFSCTISASAISYDYFAWEEAEAKLYSDTILLVNMDTGVPVFERNSRERRYPASLTKIMTYIVAIENIEDVENTRVEIKQDVIDLLSGTGSSMSGLDYKIGEKIKVIDLLYCLMVSSGNDAALVLADYIGGGDISIFVDAMNKKAQELNLEDTHFMNPHGLHDPDHYSTAYDIYTMASYALTLPYFSEITDTATYYCEGDDYPLVTTNYLIDENRGGEYYYTYAKGIKTGTTEEAGRCIATTAVADGYAYMCICMGAPYDDSDINGAMKDARSLMRWALLQLEFIRLLSVETPVCEVDVNFSAGDESIHLYPDKNINSILPKSYKTEDVDITPDSPTEIDAPVKKGDIIGTAAVYYQKELVQEVNLVAIEDVEKSDVAYTMHILKNILMSWQFWVAMIIAVILLVIYIALLNNVRQKKKQRRVKRHRRI